MQGDSISEAERRETAQKLARLTGLPADFIDRANLRIRIDRFDKELLRGQRRTVGRLDGRFVGIDKDAAGESPEYDPSYAAIFGEYTAVFNDYVRRDLKYETDAAYEILTAVAIVVGAIGLGLGIDVTIEFLSTHLVRRFPTIEPTAEPEWNGRLNLRGLEKLPLSVK